MSELVRGLPQSVGTVFRQVAGCRTIECLVGKQTQLVVNPLWHSQPVEAIVQQLGDVRTSSRPADQPCSRVHHPLKPVQCTVRTVRQQTVAIIDSADNKAVDDRSCNVEWKVFQRALHPSQLVETAADNTTDVRLVTVTPRLRTDITVQIVSPQNSKGASLSWPRRREVEHRMN